MFAIRSGKRLLALQFLHFVILPPLRHTRSSPSRSLTKDSTAPGAASPSSGTCSTPAGVNWAPRVRLTTVSASLRPPVSVVVPCYDEAEGIPSLLDRLETMVPLGWEFIFVDDGSRDATFTTLLTAARTRPSVSITGALTEATPVVPVAPPPPPFKLIGVAEDAGPAGPVRTAIVSGPGQLFLVKEGQNVTLRYRVIKISADVVELQDLGDKTTLRLALK